MAKLTIKAKRILSNLKGYKARKTYKNSDGSRTILMSKKGTQGLTVWKSKNGKATIVTIKKRFGSASFRRKKK